MGSNDCISRRLHRRWLGNRIDCPAKSSQVELSRIQAVFVAQEPLQLHLQRQLELQTRASHHTHHTIPHTTPQRFPLEKAPLAISPVVPRFHWNTQIGEVAVVRRQKPTWNVQQTVLQVHHEKYFQAKLQ
uniref:HDC10296 n=1 Tax=Drosophila melanogaster TaxID=7227 RepID=Q6IL58_DROME|nr:TPA_inf: HDC10296 [Drosophila melanogaster]